MYCCRMSFDTFQMGGLYARIIKGDQHRHTQRRDADLSVMIAMPVTTSKQSMIDLLYDRMMMIDEN